MKRSDSRTTNYSGSSFHIGLCSLGCAIFGLLLIISGMARAQDVISHDSKTLPINSSAAVDPQSPSWSPAIPIPAPIKRGYYLTSSNFYATQALTACAKGYHTASMWELLDVSNLNYHYNHPYAMTRGDSGYGPPAERAGWVRTGTDGGWTGAAGQTNCLNWTDTGASNHGTAVYLWSDWNSTPGRLGPWSAMTVTCDWPIPVWCVSNVRW
jgi:hypothetical protein